MVPPKTCRAVYSNIINYIKSHLVGKLLTLIHDARSHGHKKDIQGGSNMTGTVYTIV